MSLKERVLDILKTDHGVDEEGLAEQLSHVVKGEKVQEEYNTTGKLTKRKVTRAPADMARGLVIFDKLSGGQLELSGKDPTKQVNLADFYRKFAPVVDGRVVRSPHQIVEVTEDDEQSE